VVQDWAKSPAHVIVDSRDASRYAGIDEPIDPVAGHIPSAVNLPFKENVNENGRWKSKEELRARFSGVASVSTPENIVFYCGSGVTGCHNVLAFCHAGLGDARLYPGSWSEWIADPKREIETG
jgi:thiosulfate/3-mercaptopyruvate sulfurtransferase